MNKNQKLVQQQFLNNEKEVIRRLRLTYGQALKDVDTNIKNLDMDINGIQVTIDMFDNMGGSPEDKAQLQSMLQSKIYQKQYQEALQGQIDDVMKKLHKNAYATVDEYVNDCYSEAFIGAAFDLHGQGIPLIMPIDQESVVRAVQLDSKINKGLYFHLGESVNGLKQTISNEVSRGLVNGSTYAQIAQQISFKMVGTYQNPGGAMAYAMRIARTEGHRIQCQAGMDACYKAKDMGADVVKQWDSTLDGRTRSSHRKVDGEIRELDEPFSNGLQFPGDPSGVAEEVIHCRCALLERARWALDDDELETLKQRAEYYGLDKSENFEDFKKKYLKAVENSGKDDIIKSKIFTSAKTRQEAEAFANSLGLDCSYQGVDIQVANDMNAAFDRAVRYCPDVKNNLHMVGSAQQRNKMFRAEMTKYYDDYLRQNYPGYSDAWYKKYAESYARKSVGNVSSNTYAFASRTVTTGNAKDIVNKYSGVFVNNTYGKNADDFIKHLQSDVKSGWHPVGCDTVASVFDHEMAHQIDYATGLRTNREMTNLWNSLTKKEIEDGLSKYGATKLPEFIAEGYAEYCNNPTPRPIATRIGQIIEKAVNKNG